MRSIGTPILLVLLGLSACANGDDGGGSFPSSSSQSGGGGGTGGGGGAGGGGGGASSDDAGGGGATPDASSGTISGGGTGFTSAKQMFDFVNQCRQQYANHIPYDGYPFQGQNASSRTWSLQLAWDDSLAAKAQSEADRLAAGGQPQGQYFPFMNDGAGEGFSTWGLDAPAYFVETKADGSLPPFVDAYGQTEPPHHAFTVANGFYRMAVAYQTGSGSNAQKTKLGVGAAEAGKNVTWWVLVFGE